MSRRCPQAYIDVECRLRIKRSTKEKLEKLPKCPSCGTVKSCRTCAKWMFAEPRWECDPDLSIEEDVGRCSVYFMLADCDNGQNCEHWTPIVDPEHQRILLKNSDFHG
jgi:hypothetical protein